MKSYVSVEVKVCEVCGSEWETNSLLLDKRLKESMESKTITGYGLCPEHQKLHDEGYIALIAIDETRSTNKPKNNFIKGMDGVYRTGGLAHIKREAAKRIFNCEIPSGPFMYCDDEVLHILKKMQQQ